MNDKSALVQIMAWRRSGDKPLSEPMMVYLTDAYMRHSASMSRDMCKYIILENIKYYIRFSPKIPRLRDYGGAF